MKILILTNKLPYPPKDGGSIATLKLGLSLSQLNNQVHLLAINTSKHFFDIREIPAEIKEKIEFHDVFINTRIRAYKALLNLLFSKKPYNAQRFENKNYSDKLNQLLSENNYDVIQLEGLYLTPYIPAIRKLSEALVVMRSHNVEYKIWEKQAALTSNILSKFYMKNLAKRIKKMELNAVNQYDALLPISPIDAAVFQNAGCKIPMQVLPVGIEIEDYIPDHTKQEFPSLFHIGALDWMPNTEGLSWFFNEVWPLLKEKHPALKFYLAGRNASEKFINSIHYKDVIYMGEVDDAQHFIQQKSIMIVPLFSGSGIRIKILEGMALEKVIVSTSLGAEGIPVKDKKNILLANSREEFVEKINFVIADKKAFNAMSEQARIFVKENFDTFNLTNQLLSFYKQNLQ